MTAQRVPLDGPSPRWKEESREGQIVDPATGPSFARRGAPYRSPGQLTRARRGRLFRALLALVFILGLPHAGIAGSDADTGNGSRFVFAGNGRLRLAHGHFAETLDVRYRRADGTYDDDALARVRHFFRSREDGREGDISLRLVEQLAFVQAHFRPQSMTLLSGYRSPEFNDNLRSAGGKAAKASLHTEGLAADIAFTGADLRRLWLQLRELGTGGAGYYKTSRFLHLDTGKPRFWEETTSRVDENLSAGNQRMFARTDYDRYGTLDGAVVSLHSITVFPVSVARAARLVGSTGEQPVELAPLAGTEAAGDCITVPAFADAYRLRVVNAGTPEAVTGAHLVVTTCEPRIESTPREVETNAVEVMRR